MSATAKKETPKVRRFEVEVRGSFIVEVTEELLAEVLNDDWRQTFYKIHTPEGVAEHLAYAMVVQRFPFSSLDGFARLPDDAAKIKHEDWDSIATAIPEPEPKRVGKPHRQKPPQMGPRKR